MKKNIKIYLLLLLPMMNSLHAQQLIGNTWMLKKSFVTVGTDTANLYVRNDPNNILDLSQISLLFKPSGIYSGTAVNNSAQTGTWNLNGAVLTLDGEPGDYFPLNAEEFLVSSPFFVLDTVSGQFNIPAVSHLWFTTLTANLPVTVTAKVYLQGPYVSTPQLMHDSLRVKNLIPLTEPYTGLTNFTHVGGGGEQTNAVVLTVTGANAIVDWVFLELRSAATPTQVLATRSALLQRDGDVVEVNGTSPVQFNLAVSPEYYYLTVRHRNHFGVQLGATKFYPKGITVTTDFRTLPPEGFYNYNSANATQRLISGKYVMWAGNGRIDYQLKYNGGNNDRNTILSVVGLTTPNLIVNGYNPADYNMDGQVKYNGTNNDRNLLLGNVGLTTPNNILQDQIAH